MKKISYLLGSFVILVLVGAGCSGDSVKSGGGGLAEGTGVITVSSPAPGDTLSSGFRVEGDTFTEDGEVYLRLLDKDGVEIVGSHVQKSDVLSGTEDGYVFTYIIFFSKNYGDGVLEVFWQDGDGNESDLLQIPVVIGPKE